MRVRSGLRRRALPYALFFSALGSEPRMRILASLQEGPKSVGEICRETRMEQSLVSHHLRCLSFCGFVRNRRQGRSVIYSLNQETLPPLLKLAERHIGRYARRLTRCKVLRY